MCAMQRRGQAVDESASCDRCLYVKRDLRRRDRAVDGESGDEATKF